MKKSFTYLFLLLTTICFGQQKDTTYYKNYFHNQYENKQLSTSDSIEAATCLQKYITMSLENEETETAQSYANILYAYVGKSDVSELRIKTYDIKIKLADESTSKEILRHYYQQIIDYHNLLLEKKPNESKLIEDKLDYLKLWIDDYYFDYAYDSTRILTKYSLELAEEHNILPTKAVDYNLLGIIHDVAGNYPIANEYYDKALQTAELMQDSFKIMNFSMNKGAMLCNLSQYEASTSNYLKAIDYAKALNETTFEGDLYINLSINYSDLEDFEKATKYLEFAKEKYLEANYREGLMYYYSNIGTIYEEQEAYDKALEANKTLIELANEFEDSYFLLMGVKVNGLTYLKQRKYKRAKESFQEAIRIAKQHEFYVELLNSQIHLGEIQLINKEYQTVIETLGEIKAQDTLLIVSQQVILNNTLAQAYAGLEKYDKAYPLYIEYKALQDSTLNEENIRTVTRLEADHAHNKEMERQELLHQATMERQAIVRKTLLVGLSLVGLLAFFIFMNYRNKAKANRLLEQKNKEILQQKEQLEQLNHTKDRIFAIIGHDLRKPAISFRGISKKVNYLIQKQDFATLDELGKQIEEDALALNKLTDNLLNWALTQRNVMPYNPIEVAINEQVTRVQSIFATPAREKGVQIFNTIPAEMNVYADPNALLTILINLVDNAVKYTPEGGKISISALEENDKQLKIRVSDTGIGMDIDQLNDLFLLRKDKSQKGTEGEKGTGLGMHLVKELVELNKGIISAVSELGKGTSFDLLLPVA